MLYKVGLIYTNKVNLYICYTGWRPFPNALLLGDSGYFNRNWLLTPVVNEALYPPNAVRNFLRRLKSTRRIVECALGLFKEEFPCMNHLRLKKPENCSKLILMCFTIYNIQNEFRHERHEEHVIDMDELNRNEENDNEGGSDDDGDVADNLMTQSEIIHLMNTV